jgi:hypothetical protein
MPGGVRISIAAGATATSMSISLSSSSPSRSFLRNFCRVPLSSAAGAETDRPGRGQQHVEDAVLGGVFGARAHRLHRALAQVLDGDLDQIADDGVDIAADIAHLGELGRLHLDEGRIRQTRQPARDLGLADAGRADHQDVLRRDFAAQRLGHLGATPAVAQRDSHRALGARLADDVLVQFGHDFGRGHDLIRSGHGAHHSMLSMV